MRTRMTEVFGVKYPIMLAGMAYVSLPKLVAAVSDAGGLGTYNSVANTPDGMREEVVNKKESKKGDRGTITSDFLIPYGKTAPFKENKLAHFSGLL